jgi:hypothetical protein
MIPPGGGYHSRAPTDQARLRGCGFSLLAAMGSAAEMNGLISSVIF